MGWNTTVVVMNDALDMIEKDPYFGYNLGQAIKEAIRGNPVDVPARSYRNDEDKAAGKWAGVHCNAATVIETHHADGTALVAVGQNYGRKLGEFYPYGEGSEDERLLKALADKLGYRVVKKAVK